MIRKPGEVVGIGFVARSPEGGYPEVVEELEAILGEARRGEIESFGIFKIRPNGKLSTFFTPTSQAHMLIAGCEYMKADMIAAQNKEGG